MKKLIFSIIFFVFLTPFSSNAADENSRLYFSGLKEAVGPGSEIIVDVLLDTPYALNALDLEIKYPEEKLEFLGSQNSSSIVDIWQPEPKVLSSGNIGVSGGLLKAFVGNGANVIKLSFKVLAPEAAVDTALFSFAKNDLYLADGRGTKIPNVAGEFSLAIDKDAKVVTSASGSFKNTQANIDVQKELHRIKIKTYLMNTAIILLVLFVLVFSYWRVYNKKK